MSELHSMVGAYVADALDDAELENFESHLDSCDDCRSEVTDMRETMAELGAFHEVAPPEGLRASILGAITSTPMLPAEEPPATAPTSLPDNVVAPAHAFGRARRPVATWLAAAAAVLAVALGGVTVWQQAELQSAQSADAQRTDLLGAPDLLVATAPLEGGTVTYLVSPERGEALLASSNLPDPGRDRSWQVWVMEEGVPRSGAVLDAGGQVQAWIMGVAGGGGLAITNEPRGGSPGPTGDVLAGVEL